MADKSFIDALEEKYADCNISTSPNMYVLKNMDVAATKGKVHVPRELSLHRMGVTCAGDMRRIEEVCSQVTGLDLTNNQLTSWHEIFTLLKCTPCVSFLNLSENRLTATLVDVPELAFPNIKDLALNSTSIPLASVDALLTIMPRVEALHLCMNGYTSLPVLSTHPSVSTLYLNANNLTDFRQVLSLSASFPSLRQLLLLQNPLSCLPEPEVLQEAFHKLRCLNISETKITSWTELEKLRHFPVLTDIRLKGLPLFEGMEEKLRRQLIIGFLPNLTKLNLSDVTEDERLAAERMFIRHFNKDMDMKPRRTYELEEKHGQLEPLVDIRYDSESNLRTVQVHFEGAVSMRQVDVRDTVKTLKKRLAQEVAMVAPSKLRFYHQSPKSPLGLDDLVTSLSRQLHSLNVEDGDSFYMELK